MDERAHARLGGRLEDARRPAHVDALELGGVAAGLDQPGEVDDGVGPVEPAAAGRGARRRARPTGCAAGASRACRRAMPMISVTRSSAARAETTLVPTLPVAPVTTTPASWLEHDLEGAVLLLLEHLVGRRAPRSSGTWWVAKDVDAERVVVAARAAAGCRRPSGARWPGPSAASAACRRAASC